jgi:hypothetical protein
VVYLTQTLSNYYSLSPGNTGKHRVDSLCNCLKTKILHQSSHPDTRTAFADTIGKRKSINTSQGESRGPGGHTTSETDIPSEEYWIQPDEATLLLTGGTANKFKVTAIVSKAGKLLSDRKPYYITARFNQKDLESGKSQNSMVAIPKP